MEKDMFFLTIIILPSMILLICAVIGEIKDNLGIYKKVGEVIVLLLFTPVMICISRFIYREKGDQLRRRLKKLWI